ncbi:MAG: purine-binding chemotaxis protein CheW [Proteobacteria bacterium]|nr:purine-binding chemotaxis protein CheW [Pseudomonadota bacterium]
MESVQDQTAYDSDLYDDIDEDTQKNKYLTFNLGKEDYGLEIRHVDNIIVMEEIVGVPDMPEFILGVINLRGKVISVMDMRTRFHLEKKEVDDRTCIIVVNIDEISMGLIVDTVNEVIDIQEDRIDPAPKTHSGIKSNYIQGMGKVGDKVKILLDIEKILYSEELDQIKGL